MDSLHNLEYLDNIEHMEKPFDHVINHMSKNQLVVLRALLSKPEIVMTTREIAKKSGVVEKQLGGVLSAMSRKRVDDTLLIEAMGSDGVYGLRWRLNIKAISIALAISRVKVLLASYK